MDKTNGCMCYVAILNLLVKYSREWERCQGVPCLQILLLCLLSPLWSESANSASEVEMGGGENRGQRIEQG
jgi:hypothetical protein